MIDKALDTYYQTIKTLKNQQGVYKEGSTRRAFATLLSELAKQKNWTLVEEDAQKVGGRTIYYDGVLRDEWRLPHARWEAKDSRDDLDKEIQLKREKGYRFDNLLFEDTQTAILFQDDVEVLRADIKDRAAFTKLLDAFINYEIPPFTRFNEAVTYFQAEIPDIANGLKARIDEAHQTNKTFQAAFQVFFERCQQSLNPNISQAAVDEMLIQHMLTERLIRKIFTEEFVQRNVIAKQVEQVIGALTSQTFNRKEFLGRLERFYTAIEEAADSLAAQDDKLYFMNTVYERFFQGYSVKTADTHGIVYTPQPIVDFMCASVEEVLADEFGLELGQEGVTVLDPATGTGSFIVNLIKRTNPRYMPQFYQEQLFANEVMLMPYYIASLNAELAYFEIFKQYLPFEGMCYVDTLDLHAGAGQLNMFTEENTKRVQRQQNSPITVVIGNPPYNAGQLNENDNNKNRAYKEVDKRIRDTYVKDSTATNKNALYDMYVRFFRWAIDRLGERDGIVCFVTNN
ncbi:MAG: DNA helicase, partial [Chloroflexi bacterium]